MRHLQRIGLGGGRARQRPPERLYPRLRPAEWALALLLAELGVDPIVIVKSIQQERRQLRKWIAEATDAEALGGNEVFLAARPALMSGAWASNTPPGILRFGKFRRGDWSKSPRHWPPPPPSDRPPAKPTGPRLLAPPSLEGAQSAQPDHRLDPVNFASGSPVFSAPVVEELGFLDWADPLLLVINLTQSVRRLGAALESAQAIEVIRPDLQALLSFTPRCVVRRLPYLSAR